MYRIRAGLQKLYAAIPVGHQLCDLKQTAPDQSSRADEFEQCVLCDYRPTLALASFTHFVQQCESHRHDDPASDKVGQKRMIRPERVVQEVPYDRAEEEQQAETTENPRRDRTSPKRVCTARAAGNHLPTQRDRVMVSGRRNMPLQVIGGRIGANRGPDNVDNVT